MLGPVLDRDASSAWRWTDLGEVLSGAAAQYCYRQAGDLAPYDPQILYAIGDFDATHGNQRAALARFAAILGLRNVQGGDNAAHNVFVYYERTGIRKNGRLDEAIPDGPSARAYLRYLMRESAPGDLTGLWQWMRDKSFIDQPLTVEYVDFLFRRKRYDAAQVAWLRGFAGRGDGYSRISPVFNGGFEYELTGGVPDWRLDGLEGVRMRRDHGSRFDGEFSLRIDFSGNDNPDFHHAAQTVFVQPGTWRFEAHARTANITSDQGIRFRIVSPRDGRVLAETEALTGSNDWRRLETTFQIPRGTSLVDVQLARRRSLRIDNQLTGTAWIDAVKLTLVP